MTLSYRIARPSDYPSIADVHARSWRENYRGILTDDYLDHQLDQDRTLLWQNRLHSEDAAQRVIVATAGEDIVGFACAYAHYDETGHYLDNLHVLSAHQGQKIGRTLMHHVAAQMLSIDSSTALYLWVFAQNERALKIYQSWEGALGKTEYLEMPSGGGGGMATEVIWPDPSVLILEDVLPVAQSIPQPIACELYDHFEIAAMSRTPVLIKLRNGTPDVYTTIKTLQTRDKIEYLITAGGEEIALHEILSLSDQKGNILVDLDQANSC